MVTNSSLRRRSNPAASWGLALVTSCLIAAFGLVLNARDIAIVDTIDKLVGDWRIALGSPRAAAQRSEIAVVLINEETLLDYESRSPIDRGLLAELVTAIDAAGPRAIGIDIIFDRRTRNDEKLLAAIRSAKTPIVLGAIDHRVAAPRQNFVVQRQFLKAAGRPHGHVFSERKAGLVAKVDSTVRLVAKPYPKEAPRPAFADVLAQAAGVSVATKSRIISWLRRPASGEPLFSTLRIPRHNPTMVKPGLADIFLDSWRPLLSNRIVLVGAQMIDSDQHITPLTVLSGKLMPGVMIHAQVLAQRLDGNRDILEWPWWITYLVVALTTLACFGAARHFGINPRGLLYGMMGIVLIGLVSLAAFLFYRVDIPSIALGIAWLGGGFAGFISRWLIPLAEVEA